MASELVRHESLVEYFKRLVEEAMRNQHVEALDLTEYYLVQLLARFARMDARRGDDADDEPLALRLSRALEQGGARQRAELRRVGDESLFLSGFFSDSLERGPVPPEYYASLGAYAYASLSREDEDVLAPAFGELAHHFTSFADILSEVSDQGVLSTPTNLLRLYDRWMRGSQRSGARLLQRGLVPPAAFSTRLH